MASIDKQTDFRDGYLRPDPKLPPLPEARSKTLLAVLFAYAVGVAILMLIAEAGQHRQVDAAPMASIRP